ncbi:MAG: hypothetical protein AAB368_11455, partial [bacterium]
GPAAAVLVSGLASPDFQETGLDGAPVTAAAGPAALNAGVAGSWRAGAVTGGVAVRSVAESLGVKGVPAYHVLAFDAGIVDAIRSVQLGAAVRGLGHAPVVNVGAAWRLPWAAAVADGEWNHPLAGRLNDEARAGVTWHAHAVLDLRAGGGAAGPERFAAAGFTVRLGRAWLDYVYSTPLAGGLGAWHLLGLGLSSGLPR